MMMNPMARSSKNHQQIQGFFGAQSFQSIEFIWIPIANTEFMAGQPTYPPEIRA